MSEFAGISRLTGNWVCRLALLLLTTAANAQQQFANIGDLELLSGDVLEDVRVGYITAGTLNPDRSNVIVFPTWFTGTARNLFDFGVIGPAGLADTDRYFVVAIDALANGISTSPSNSKNTPGAAFPPITMGDMVNAQYRLLTEHLDIHRAHAIMGISMGGMQTFDWLSRYPTFMEKAVPIDGSPRMTSYDLLVWGVNKRIIETLRDDGRDDAEIFALVGPVSQLSLRTPDWFVENVPPQELEAFLDREASAVFDSYDYERQLDAMMALDLLGTTDATRRAWTDRVQAQVLVVNGRRDHMVNPVPGQRAAVLLESPYHSNNSNCGHLGNVCEVDTTRARVHEFLELRSTDERP